MLETIYVKIPSLDDKELVHTLKDCLNKAKHPERIHIGVSLMYQDKENLDSLLIFKNQYANANVKIVTRELDKDFLGVGKQRKVVGDMFDGQDYVLQIDSHTWFCEGWDNILINLHKNSDWPKTILTAYAGRYQWIDGFRQPIEGGRLRYPWIRKGERQYCSFTDNWEDLPYDGIAPYVPTKFCANFAFGTKEWGIKTGLAADSIFFSEEPLQTEYLKTNGFSLLFPNVDYPLICHLYHQHTTEQSERKSFTDYLSDEEADYLMNVVDKDVYTNHMLRINKYTRTLRK